MIDPDGNVLDVETHLTWHRTLASMGFSWTGAATYCATLPDAGGGWRLPSVRELMTIVDTSQTTAPAIDPTAFPNTPTFLFWSSSPYLEGDGTTAMEIDFTDGTVENGDVTNGDPVRCVR